MRRLPLIREAATIAWAGMDPIAWLESKDQTRVMTMQAIAMARMDLEKEASNK